jgi:hypothetical protein
MEQANTVKFEDGGKHYEIRVAAGDTAYTIRAFLDGSPLKASYSVAFETASDFKLYNGESAVNELVEIVKDDIRRGHI